MTRRLRAFAAGILAFAVPGVLYANTTTNANVAVASASSPNPHAIFWVAVVGMSAFLVMSLGGMAVLLRASASWSLGDAPSEEAGNQPTLPVGVKPVMVASASRTIAMFGPFVPIASTLNVGFHLLWARFYERPRDALQKIPPFSFSSAVIFAPYAVNQMKEAFTSLSPPPRTGG